LDSKTSFKATQPKGRKTLSDDEYGTRSPPAGLAAPELDVPPKEPLKSPDVLGFKSSEEQRPGLQPQALRRYSLPSRTCRSWWALQGQLEARAGERAARGRADGHAARPEGPRQLEKMTALGAAGRLTSPGDGRADRGRTRVGERAVARPLHLRHEKIFQREDSSWKLQGSSARNRPRA
ncbi:unnamed protein product, partial [Arctogadus glacialis]